MTWNVQAICVVGIITVFKAAISASHTLTICSDSCHSVCSLNSPPSSPAPLICNARAEEPETMLVSSTWPQHIHHGRLQFLSPRQSSVSCTTQVSNHSSSTACLHLSLYRRVGGRGGGGGGALSMPPQIFLTPQRQGGQTREGRERGGRGRGEGGGALF